MPTPKFWATLRNYMALATTLFMGVIAIGDQYLPEWATWVSQHAVAVSLFAGIICQFAVYDKDKHEINSADV